MRMLIATDGSDCSKGAVIESARYINPETTAIEIVSALEDPLPMAAISTESYQLVGDSITQLAVTSVKEAESELRNQFKGKHLDLATKVLHGCADQMIIDEAKRWHADLIVVGCRGRGFLGRLLGSVSNDVVHHGPCSVLVVRKSTA